ncbi:MAG: hypothetical protein AAGF99_05560 [Bacteroidota bacterium]
MFTITGRGVVAAGEVLDGAIRVGDCTEPLDGRWPEGLRVHGLAGMRRIDKLERGAGLLFKGVEAAELKRLLPADRVLVFREPPVDQIEERP